MKKYGEYENGQKVFVLYDGWHPGVIKFFEDGISAGNHTVYAVVEFVDMHPSYGTGPSIGTVKVNMQFVNESLKPRDEEVVIWKIQIK